MLGEFRLLSKSISNFQTKFKSENPKFKCEIKIYPKAETKTKSKFKLKINKVCVFRKSNKLSGFIRLEQTFSKYRLLFVYANSIPHL